MTHPLANASPTTDPIPPIENVEQYLLTVRRRLKDIVLDLNLVHDVIVVCKEAREAVNTDLDAEVAHVLRRCGSEPLLDEMMSLTRIVHELGGTTAFSDDVENEDEQAEIEAAQESGGQP